ncbi:MAG: hypothetical protein DELT_03303 [Desulfovibrio sp.]
MTFMPMAEAALATIMPIAPRPITPRVLPLTSPPTNWPFPFSTSAATPSWPFKVLAQSYASGRLRDAEIIAPITSSFTPFAFAPGVLNTTMPFSVHWSIGMLFVPAPARAMAMVFPEKSMPWQSALRTMNPSLSSSRWDDTL